MPHEDHLDALASRRTALKLIGGLVLAAPLAATVAGDASARRTWCRTDPAIELRDSKDRKGNAVCVYVSAALTDYEANNSSGDIVIVHPKDAKTNKLWEDPNGYFGQGISTNFAINERYRFHADGMDVGVKCYIPASRRFDILLEWAPGPLEWAKDGTPIPGPVTASAWGQSNRWFSLKSFLPYA